MKKTNKKEKIRKNKSKRKDRKVREENKMKEKIKSKKKVIIIASIAVILILAVSILAIYLTKNNQEQNSAKAEEKQENRQEEKQKETEEMNEEKEQNKNNSSVIQAQENEKSFVREDNEYMTVYTDSEENKAPIPRGYVVSEVKNDKGEYTERTINTGLVIYEIAEEEKDKIDWTADANGNNFLDVQESYNQYVWVPVDDPSEMYGVDSNGKKWGKLYNFSTTGTTNNNWTESNAGMKITDKNYGDREPDVVKTYDKDSLLRKYDIGTSSMNEFKMELEKEFNQMIASVEKYGGFYIGRYETGDISKSIPVVRKGNSDISNQTWYAMYKRSKKLAGANTNVKTSMIWGCQWDATLRWFLTSEEEEIVKYVTDSTGKGNYSGSKKATGSSEAYKVNNIYDMAGNAWDWTIEADSTSTRVGRRRSLLRFRL